MAADLLQRAWEGERVDRELLVEGVVADLHKALREGDGRKRRIRPDGRSVVEGVVADPGDAARDREGRGIPGLVGREVDEL